MLGQIWCVCVECWCRQPNNFHMDGGLNLYKFSGFTRCLRSDPGPCSMPLGTHLIWSSIPTTLALPTHQKHINSLLIEVEIVAPEAPWGAVCGNRLGPNLVIAVFN
jgi:hypothetical protein